jgi:hypothetical protein
VGAAKGKEDVAKNMLRNGFPHEQVVKLAELDIEKVKPLSDSLDSPS